MESLSLSLSREIVGPLALALAAVFLSVTAAWAYDCTTEGHPGPYTPSEVDELRRQVLYENACCCYNNEIIAWTQDPVLDREDYCCDVPNENCNTYYIIVFRTATPQAIPDAINNWDGQHVTFTPWSKNTIDRWCFCDGVGTWCNWVLRSGTIYSFDCNPCP